MSTIIVLFNLKPGVDRAEYEQWARDTDLPEVRRLGSVDGFEILRAEGQLSGAPSPYDYCEIIRVGDLAAFDADLASEAIQRVAAEYLQYADAPVFIRTEAL